MDTQTKSTPPPPPRSAPSQDAPRAGDSAAPHVSHDRLSDAPPPSAHGWVWFLLLLAAVAVAGYFLYPKIAHYFHGSSGGAGAPRGPREIPVVAATARKGELNLYLNGLGAVTPFSTATVRSRVDGEIMKILFHEGQVVEAGAPPI